MGTATDMRFLLEVHAPSGGQISDQAALKLSLVGHVSPESLPLTGTRPFNTKRL